MTDRDLERTLRATLTGRAGTVTSGPAWDGADDDLTVAPATGRRWQLFAPIVAAVLVLGVAGGVIAYRHDGGRTNPPPAATGQVRIPAGMQAVDALGVEVFVPSTFKIDPLCSQPAVFRPVPHIASADCPYFPGPVVTIADAGAVANHPCATTVTLDTEAGCVVAQRGTAESGSGGEGRQPTDLTVAWPKHDVRLSVSRTFDEAFGLRIIRSAHAVPVDRHGCAADRDPIEPPGKHDPASIGGAPAVPEDRPANSMRVCWYIADRLAASASLGGQDAGTALHAAAGATALFSPSSDCSDVDHTDGVVLAVRYAGGGSAEGILRAAACPGRSSQAVGSSFVTTLGRLAGMPLVLGYPTTR